MTKRAYGLMGVLLVLIFVLCSERAHAQAGSQTATLNNVCNGYRLVRSGPDILLMCPTRRGWVRQVTFKDLCHNDPPTRIYTKNGRFWLTCNSAPNPYKQPPPDVSSWGVLVLPDPPKR